jgi:hypothetical protein
VDGWNAYGFVQLTTTNNPAVAAPGSRGWDSASLMIRKELNVVKN